MEVVGRLHQVPACISCTRWFITVYWGGLARVRTVGVMMIVHTELWYIQSYRQKRECFLYCMRLTVHLELIQEYFLSTSPRGTQHSGPMIPNLLMPACVRLLVSYCISRFQRFWLMPEYLRADRGSGVRASHLPKKNREMNSLSLIAWSQSTTPTSIHIALVCKTEGMTLAFPCVFWELAYFLFVYCLCVSVLLFWFPW